MDAFLEGITHKKATQKVAKLQKQSTFSELEDEFEQQQLKDREKQAQVIKSTEIRRQSMTVQIDDIMLFFLQSNLSKEMKDLMEKILRKMKVIESKLSQINPKFEHHQHTLQMMSSLYNYAISLKTQKGDKLQQFKQWSEEFPCQIVVKNDGNCFYRAFLFKYILFIILKQNKEMLEKSIQEIINLPPLQHGTDNFPDLQDDEVKYIFILFFVKNFQKIQNRKMFSVIDLIQEYNSNPLIDLCSIVLVRNIIYQFYLKIKQSGHYTGWIQTFEKEKNHLKLTNLGKDAEQQIMILTSQAFEAKVFALTFYQNENGKVASQINEFYMQQIDYNVSIYVLFTNDHYNILLENIFLRQHELYFKHYLEEEDKDQNLIYFEKDGQKTRYASQLFESESQSSIQEKEVLQTNFFQRLQLQDPSMFLKESLLTDFGFKKQISAAQNQGNEEQKENTWLLTGEDEEVDLPLFNPLAMQQSYKLDFKTYLEQNQLSKIDSIRKKDESGEFHEVSQTEKQIIQDKRQQFQSQKKVRMSIQIETLEDEETPTPVSQPTSSKVIKSIYKKPTVDLPGLSEQQIQRQQSIEETQSDEESGSSKENPQKQLIIMDQRCLDCDKLTSFKDKIIVTKIVQDLVICNQCVRKKVHFLQSNRLSSMSFYGFQLYRFQMLDLLNEMDDLAEKSFTSIDKDLYEGNKHDDSLELIIHKTEKEILLSQKLIPTDTKPVVKIKCASCSRPNQEPKDIKQSQSYFINIDNYNKTKKLLICKTCLSYFNDDAINRKYLSLFKVKDTFLDPNDVTSHYNKIIQELNRSGDLLQCQFFCKLEDKKSNMAASLFDTEENQLIQKKICLPCFEKILQSSMNVDNLIQMPCQIKLFANIFKEDFLNDICIQCNTSQLSGKKDYTLKSSADINSTNILNNYFRVTESMEKFDSFICLQCIKNVLIDQYTHATPSQDNTSAGEEFNSNQRQFKILYRKIGVIFNFTYSPFINRQILKALKNESQKNLACFKCLSKTSQPLYFLNNPDNNSLCQSCFILIHKQNNRQDIVSKLKISESQYVIIKEGTLQHSFQHKFCFSCVSERNKIVYHVWVKDYNRVLLLCSTCIRESKVYFTKDVFQLYTPFYREKIHYQSVDIPKQLIPKENTESDANENSQSNNQNHQKGSEQPIIQQKTTQSLTEQEKPCFKCQSIQKKAVKLYGCECWLCIKCITAIVTSDNKDFMLCPTKDCIQKYQKIEIINYLDELTKEEKRRMQLKKIENKMSRQNQSKFLCNCCKTPHIPVVITKQKYCSCVILCKQCLIKIYKNKQCYKCLEMNWNVNKGDIQIFDENALCCSCLDPLNLKDLKLQEQPATNITTNKLQRKQQVEEDDKKQQNQIKCVNCLYVIKLLE